MKGLIGHMGSWAPKPEQLATAWFLEKPELVKTYMDQMNEQVERRLHALWNGIQEMKSQGLPVDAVAPQGAIYLSFKVDLIGDMFPTNESIRKWLLEEAGVAVVPFQAFDMPEESGWFRMSIGAVSMQDITGALSRLKLALQRL